MSGEDYQSALDYIERALKDALRAYVDWHIANWQITREQWSKEFVDEPPEGDYFDGYNAGIESAKGSLDAFLDEFHP